MMKMLKMLLISTALGISGTALADEASDLAALDKAKLVKDYDKVFTLTKMFAEKGERWAQRELVELYLLGEGTKRSYTEAKRWLVKMDGAEYLECKFADSLYAAVANRSYSDKSAPAKDAIRAYEKLAANKQVCGHLALANAYETGWGKTRSMKKARAHLKAACKIDPTLYPGCDVVKQNAK